MFSAAPPPDPRLVTVGELTLGLACLGFVALLVLIFALTVTSRLWGIRDVLIDVERNTRPRTTPAAPPEPIIARRPGGAR